MWKKFDISTTPIQRDDIEVSKIKIDGYLDSSTFPKLQEHLAQMVAQNRIHLLLNLADLDYISSAGLGVLLRTQKRLMASGSGLKMVNVNSHIGDIFRFSGFDQIFEIQRAPDA